MIDMKDTPLFDVKVDAGFFRHRKKVPPSLNCEAGCDNRVRTVVGDVADKLGEPGKTPISIDACGRSGAAVDLAYYASHGCDSIPIRGPLAANTVAGTVSGWQKALETSLHW